jgi:hypothetical protein
MESWSRKEGDTSRRPLEDDDRAGISNGIRFLRGMLTLAICGNKVQAGDFVVWEEA